MAVPTFLTTTDPSAGYLALTTKYYGNAKASHEAICPMQSYRAEGYGRLFLLLFLTHYMLYLDIQASEDLCITSYCDNHSLLKNEENFRTRDINSSSWYINPDHDVIMTLSALRTRIPITINHDPKCTSNQLPFRLTSIHVRAYEDGHCELNLLPRPT